MLTLTGFFTSNKINEEIFNSFDDKLKIYYLDIFKYLKYTKKLQPIVFGKFLKLLLKSENIDLLIKYFPDYKIEYINKLIDICENKRRYVGLADILIINIFKEKLIYNIFTKTEIKLINNY